MYFRTIIALLLMCAGVFAQPQRFSPQIERQLAALKKEPSVVEAQAAALRFFNVNPDAVRKMRERAAWKGLMPRLDTRYRLNQSDMSADTKNLNVDANEPFLFDAADGRVQEFQIGLNWDLPALVFNAEVLDVGSLAVLQEGVLKEVTRLYYTRRRLQIDLILDPPRDPRTELSKKLRIEELTSTLNAMTGNLFLRYEQNKLNDPRTRRRR